MSYSTLYGIKNDYSGEALFKYKNSWCFSPVVWRILSDKNLPRDHMGYIQSVIGSDGGDVWIKINSKMNNSDNTPDRICWEMSNQLIFFTNDKQCIAANIRKFVEQNKDYDKSDEDNLSSLEREQIIERFNEIADDILGLDEKKYPYFAFKNTSCDDTVEFWFRYFEEDVGDYVNRSINDLDEEVTQFVVIQNNKIVRFISNLDYNYD